MGFFTPLFALICIEGDESQVKRTGGESRMEFEPGENGTLIE